MACSFEYGSVHTTLTFRTHFCAVFHGCIQIRVNNIVLGVSRPEEVVWPRLIDQVVRPNTIQQVANLPEEETPAPSLVKTGLSLEEKGASSSAEDILRVGHSPILEEVEFRHGLGGIEAGKINLKMEQLKSFHFELVNRASFLPSDM